MNMNINYVNDKYKFVNDEYKYDMIYMNMI